MCGIVGYIGKEQAAPILLEGLARLEYRGYDSAGICVAENGVLDVAKCKGRLKNLAAMTENGALLHGTAGIGHTRWATHGEPNDINSHPHVSQNGKVALVHNGIIENYLEIREFLEEKGVQFTSQTDSEVVAQLLEYCLGLDEVHCMQDAIYMVLHRIEGAYAFGIVCADDPERIYAARKDAPLLLGFGCSVPGVLAARTLPTRRDRALTIVLTPCMSCSAKAPVYAAFAAAFFPGRSAVVFLALYALGILAAAGAARLLGRTVLRGEAASFVLELPDYRWPDARSVLRRMWVRTKEFLTRAFTVILAASVGVWVLRTFTPTWRVATNAGESLLAVAGQALAPVFAPLGFGDWRAATALVTGLLAKETVLSTLGVLLGGDLTAALPGVFSPAAAASFLVFTALYAPCVAAQAAMRQELGSRLGALTAAIGSCAAAWCAAAVVYRIAILL